MTITMRKVFCTILCSLAVILWCMADTVTVLSANTAGSGNGSLTLWCVKDDDIVADMHWQIYRVGHREEEDYIFEGDFAGYRATLGDKTKPMLEWDTDTVASAGEALKLKTIVDQIPNRGEGYTNAQGALTFTGLEDGLYLVWGDVLKKEKTTYIPAAIFFEMRGEDAAVLSAYPKIVLYTLDEQNINHSVRKVWLNDEEQPWNRSVSITVSRFRDNQFYDDIELSADNDWTYSWEDTADHVWFVYEKVIPAHYSVAYHENHKQYLIVNTYDSDEDDSSTTDVQTTTSTDDQATEVNTTTTKSTADSSSETTTALTTAGIETTSGSTTFQTTGSNVSDTTPGSSTRSTTHTQTTTAVTTSKEDEAPRTGQLWWPVPCLTIGGLLCFGIGMKLTKKDEHE